VTSEVNILLALKKQYKDLTGKDYMPAQQQSKNPDAAAKAKQTEPAKKADQKKKQDQEKEAGKSNSNAKDEKANTDTSKQSSTQVSQVDKDSSGAREIKKVTR